LHSPVPEGAHKYLSSKPIPFMLTPYHNNDQVSIQVGTEGGVPAAQRCTSAGLRQKLKSTRTFLSSGIPSLCSPSRFASINRFVRSSLALSSAVLSQATHFPVRLERWSFEKLREPSGGCWLHERVSLRTDLHHIPRKTKRTAHLSCKVLLNGAISHVDESGI
jgi:hypothetical protein